MGAEATMNTVRTSVQATLLAAALIAADAEAAHVTEWAVPGQVFSISFDPYGGSALGHYVTPSELGWIQYTPLGHNSVAGSSSLQLVAAGPTDVWVGDTGGNQIFRYRSSGATSSIPVP